MRLIDQPCSRKQHSGEIPLIGGVSLYFCLMIMAYWLPISNYAYLSAATLIVISGILDDYKNISFKIRLSTEIIAVLIIIYEGGVKITSLGDIFGFGELQLGQFSTIFTIFAVVGGINAFNMMDGIDGLAGSLAVIILSLILLSSFGNENIMMLCLILISSIMAFLAFNLRLFKRQHAVIFLGDTGSMLIGFSISYLVVLISQAEINAINPVTALWIMALPLVDAVAVILRRLKKGSCPFSADREHLHHILPLAGYSVNQTVMIMSLLCFIFGAVGIVSDVIFDVPEWLMFYLFLLLFYVYYKWVVISARVQYSVQNKKVVYE